jgi:signal transduction histidine kinase
MDGTEDRASGSADGRRATSLSAADRAALEFRVRELSCLLALDKLAERERVGLDEFLSGAARLLPPAFGPPGPVTARVELEGRSFAAPDRLPGGLSLASPILLFGRERGTVEVVRAAPAPPFRPEERELLDAVAGRVAHFVARREAAEARLVLEDQLRHAERLATIGQLAAGLAHELNEPLANILGFIGLARKEPGLSARALADLDKASAAALHAREVVRKLRDFTRRAPPARVRLDLNRVVRDALYLLEARCGRQGIRLELELAPGGAEVHADPTQLAQILLNLAVNAVQAMPAGGCLTLATDVAQGRSRLTVADTGEGMNEEVRSRLFLPFFTTKDRDQGTGLGLALVHAIVTDHGGRIDVESEPARGSRFLVTFPAAAHTEETP